MAKYTIELRKLVSSGFEIFDDSWRTYIPEHKQELVKKIIRHYWFYEIGVETADRFKFNINEQLALIMPYYNQLYMSELLTIEPLFNHFLEETEGIEAVKKYKKDSAKRTQYERLHLMANSIKRISDGTSNTVGVGNLTGNETWREDRTINTTETTDQDTTEKTVQNKTGTEDTDTTSKEVMQDTIEGTRVTDGTSHVVTSSERRYSDTPQGTISSSGVDIDNSYLTNYTKENGTSDTTTHEDQTTKSTENKTDDITGTKDTTTTEELNKDVTGTNDVTKTVKTTDGVIGSKDRTQDTKENEDVTTRDETHEFSNGSNQDNDSETSYADEKQHEEQDQQRKRTVKEYTVSQSELLEAYRKTFLNIDEMIIKQLSVNFMGIF